jgi:mono/diheme cytochrome c family protein
MRNFLLLTLLVLILCTACNSKKENTLNTAALPTQVVTIDPSKDTTLQTRRGAIIRIPKDALQVDGKSTVQLEIKEAYDITEMVMGGPVTQSDGEPLSSGGMIYINAVGENTVRITKPISVALPTPFLDDKMQLYKGDVNGDGTINWKDPKPLPDNPQLKGLQAGRAIFINNCATCHGIDKDITGPALAHILKRSSWMFGFPGNEGDQYPHNLLYEFTRNSQEILADKYDYFNCLFNRYHKALMPSYPNLTDQDLNNLYAYIENESEAKNLPIPDNGILKCADSCRIYNETKANLEQIKARLEQTVHT